MVLGDLLSTHLNFLTRNVLYILLGIRYFQLGIVINGMIGFYFFKLAQSIWLGCWNKEGIQNLSVVCKIRSCLIVSQSRQDKSISSVGDLPLLSHNWRKKICLVLFTIINPSLIKLDRSGGGREEEGQIRRACWVWRPRGRLWGTQLVSYIYPNLKWLQGGSVAERSAPWTRNPSVPGSSPPLDTCWNCSRSSQVQILVNSQPVACRQLGFLILLCYA